MATFQTIYPGWYRGRAVHIHMKVHVNSATRHTGQLFFDDALNDSVYENAPYSTKGPPDMRNADDSIFQDAGADVGDPRHDAVGKRLPRHDLGRDQPGGVTPNSARALPPRMRALSASSRSHAMIWPSRWLMRRPTGYE